jgi:hypothetical protein
MKSALLVVVVVCVFAGIAVADDEFEFFEGGPPYPGGGDHPPGVGHHPLGVGRHAPVWSQWRAYQALQAWKRAITDDPQGILKTWEGPGVCGYTGVFCSPPLDPELSNLEVVAGIDLNGADLKGRLVPELGLLREIALFHLNSNRFSGTVPDTFKYMVTLFELDLSNNKLSGTFPEVVLEIPGLNFLDIRFNKFEGELPRGLFSKPLDAIFVNNNDFHGDLPDTFGQSNSSAIVLANNNFHGAIPKTISQLKETLQEIVALNNNFHDGLPSAIGDLENAHLFDWSENLIHGGLPSSVKDMSALQTFAMSKNRLSGKVTGHLCKLKELSAVVLDDNFFNREDPSCTRLGNIISLKDNCLPNVPDQKSNAVCAAFNPPPHPPPPSPPPPSPPPPSPSPPPHSPPPPPPPCPDGYKLGRHSRKCFKLVEECKNWDDAEFYCRQQCGGNLAAVADWEELEDLGYLCSKVNETRNGKFPRGQGCYLGGRKPNVSPPSKGWSYPLSPCVQFNQSFWNDGQPDNQADCESCLAVQYGSEAQWDKLPYMLSDLSCDVELPFICTLKRCDHTGCDLAETCKSMGDKWASCSSDWNEAVGYKCNCSEGYQEDDSGTCIRKQDN